MKAGAVVGIVTKNRADIVSAAIESALAQSFSPLRVAIVDDGSVDSTVYLKKDYPSVDWLRRSTSQGYLSARNLLMANAKEPFFVSLDDDARFLRGDEIEIAIECFRADPRLGAVAFDILSPDRPAIQTRVPPEPTHTFIGCGHVLRLSAASEIDFYAPLPGSYGSEEKDMCLRLLDRGWDVRRLPGVHVWHEKTAVSRNVREQHQSGVCNDLVFALRRYPLNGVIFALPVKIFSHLIFSLRSGLLIACIRGIFQFLGAIPMAVSFRKPVRWRTLSEFRRRSRACL